MKLTFPGWTRHALAGVAGLLFLLALFSWDAMHALDAWLATRLQTGEIPFSKEIIVVDVPKGSGIPDFRNRLGAMLQNLAADQHNEPRAVGLDIWFDTELPDHKAVLDGIRALGAHKVPVIGAVNIFPDNGGDFDLDFSKRHLMALYSQMDGVGHNTINKPKGKDNWAFYVPCPGGPLPVAMAVLLANRPDLCDRTHGVEQRIPLGAPLLENARSQVLGVDPICPHGWREYAGECLAAPPEFKYRILVVGRLTDDRSPYAGRPGPEIIAWAVNDLLGSGGRSLVNNAALHLLLALSTAGIALLLFVVLLRVLRRWRLTPLRIALVAGSVALILPFGLTALARLLEHDFTQILLPVLALLMTLVLATHYRAGVVLGQERARQTMPDMEFVAYDVFVSYRHSHQEWVQANIKPMLESMRRIDGRTLSLFIDAEGIHSGENWATRLGQVIHESRVFLAVLTPDYFEPNAKGHKVCEWEMEQALQRHAQDTMTIIPVFHAGYVPDKNTPKSLPHLGPIQGSFSTDADLAAKIHLLILNALDK